ncbi:MAG: N-acetylmuramic acid 6-phosphate etherase [Bryobacterales bacterium]|jgi:N-acetylmuramic acid 6-phosphate etherase|nr:N-acetylmuramic acid 6-phosphate etherase [Bryobacterales bacterium]
MSSPIALDRLLTEQRNATTTTIDRLSTLEMLRVINREDAGVAAAVEVALPSIAEALDLIAARLTNGGRLFYTGAGTSGRLGVLDASECPPTYNVPPGLVIGFLAGGDGALRRSVEGAEDSPEQGAADLLAYGCQAGDVLVGIAASGRTPYVIGALDQARAVGAATVALSCTQGAAISAHADVAIEVLCGPEVITGSTRMKAGTATKLVLNMLSTGAMVKLGHVYGNLMVNVQQTNEKLRHRAVRIVEQALDISGEEARQALAAAGGEVKVAIAMQLLRVSADEARHLLAAMGGNLRRTVDAQAEIPPVDDGAVDAGAPGGQHG